MITGAGDWPDYGDGVIEYLLDADYQPVLAHPERMDFDDVGWHATLDRLQELGVWLQGNLRCIAGGEGPQPQRRMRGLLRDDRYHLVATDMHGPLELEGRLAGMQTIEQEAGAAGLHTLLAERPAELLMA